MQFTGYCAYGVLLTVLGYCAFQFRMYACMYVWGTPIHTHTYTHTYPHRHPHTQLHTHTNTHIPTPSLLAPTYIYIHTYIHTRTHPPTHTHTPIHALHVQGASLHYLHCTVYTTLSTLHKSTCLGTHYSGRFSLDEAETRKNNLPHIKLCSHVFRNK